MLSHNMPYSNRSGTVVGYVGLYAVCVGVCVGMKYVSNAVSKAWYGDEKKEKYVV